MINQQKNIVGFLAIIVLIILFFIGWPNGDVQESVTGQYRYQNGFYQNLTHQFQFQLPVSWTEIKGTEGCGGPVFAPKELQVGGKNVYEQEWFINYGWVTVCGPYPEDGERVGLATSTEKEVDKKAQKISLSVDGGVMQIYFYQTGADNQTEKEKLFREIVSSLTKIK